MSTVGREPLTETFREAERLQMEIDDAIAVEHFGLAAKLRDELTRLREDERLAVLDANARFYAALRSRDEEVMEALWVDRGALSTESTRAYPGFAQQSGRDAVLKCWRDVTSDRYTQIGELHCQLLRGGMSAIVTCVEWRLDWMLDGSVATPTKADDDMLSTTNIFEKGVDGSWCLVCHQAWPFSTVEEASEDEVDYDASDFPGATG